jgi:hypothetical protein
MAARDELCGYLVEARCAETDNLLLRRVYEDYTSATLKGERLEREYLREGRAAVICVYRLTCESTLVERRRTVGVALPGKRERWAPLTVRVMAEIDREGIDLRYDVPGYKQQEIARALGVKWGTVRLAIWRIRRKRRINADLHHPAR